MPRGANLQKLAEVLGVSIAYLSNDEIVDPAYGLEESPYIESARAVYGKRGAADVEQLLTQTRASSPVAMYRRKIRNSSSSSHRAYFANKQRASEKFTRKDYKK